MKKRASGERRTQEDHPSPFQGGMVEVSGSGGGQVNPKNDARKQDLYYKIDEILEKLPASEQTSARELIREFIATQAGAETQNIAGDVLQEKASEVENFFNLALDILCIADTDGFFRKVNKSWETVLGYSAEELEGRRFFDFVHPDDILSTQKAVSELDAQHPVLNFTNRYRCKDGSYRLIEWRSHPHGKLIYAAARDITDRVHSEEILKENEVKFRSLFENMEEGVALHEMIYDEKGVAIDYRILDINPAYEKHTGLSRQQAKGALSQEVYLERAPYLKEFGSVAKTGEPYTFETYFPPMDKHFHISVISPKSGQFATVFEDISAQIRREEELQQKNEEITRFTYTVSHDLKSPLVTIKSFLGYLLEDIQKNDAEHVAKDVEYIRNAANKMSLLLDELLELSRVGRKTNPPEEVSLQGVVDDAFQLVAGRITERGIKVIVTPEPIYLFGDRRRLVEIFQNLLDNAAKFMGDQPAPLVEVGVRKEEGKIILFVRDNGSGIEPRYHKNLFSLFEKLDPSTEGTGIGLALVKRIIEVHEGKIWIESEGAGKGATFLFTLAKTRLK